MILLLINHKFTIVSRRAISEKLVRNGSMFNILCLCFITIFVCKAHFISTSLNGSRFLSLYADMKKGLLVMSNPFLKRFKPS